VHHDDVAVVALRLALIVLSSSAAIGCAATSYHVKLADPHPARAVLDANDVGSPVAFGREDDGAIQLSCASCGVGDSGSRTLVAGSGQVAEITEPPTIEDGTLHAPFVVRREVCGRWCTTRPVAHGEITTPSSNVVAIEQRIERDPTVAKASGFLILAGVLIGLCGAGTLAAPIDPQSHSSTGLRAGIGVPLLAIGATLVGVAAGTAMVNESTTTIYSR